MKKNRFRLHTTLLALLNFIPLFIIFGKGFIMQFFSSIAFRFSNLAIRRPIGMAGFYIIQSYTIATFYWILFCSLLVYIFLHRKRTSKRQTTFYYLATIITAIHLVLVVLVIIFFNMMGDFQL